MKALVLELLVVVEDQVVLLRALDMLYQEARELGSRAGFGESQPASSRPGPSALGASQDPSRTRG